MLFIFLYRFITWKLTTGFKYSIKIFLAKITFLFWILLCYLLNMSSFFTSNTSWCCFVVTLFHCSSHVLIPIPRYSDCSASIPLFHQCFSVLPAFYPCSMFWCSWFYSMLWNKHFLSLYTKKARGDWSQGDFSSNQNPFCCNHHP